MSLFIKLLILAGAIFLFESLIEKFAVRDKLIRKLDVTDQQFTAYQTKTNEIIAQYKKAYNDLKKIHEDYQNDIDDQLAKNQLMTDQIVQYAYKMIEDNDRLYKRLKVVEQVLSSENPSQEKQEELIQAIKEDIKIKEEAEEERNELLASLRQQPETDHNFNMEMGDD